MDFYKSRDMSKVDFLVLGILGFIIIILISLHKRGYEVGALILISIFLFFLGAVFRFAFIEKKVDIEYPDNWDETRKRILSRDSFTCCNCSATNIILHVHHVVPLTCGGTSSDSNLITLCENCHKSIHPHMR